MKRFVNIYRIVRARLSFEERREFLGESEAPAAYPIVSLLIAVETGQSLDFADSLYAKLTAEGGSLPVDDSHGADFRKAVEAVQAQRKGASISGQDCARWARLVRRYSFNRYAA